jgi:hypothetical protein
LGQDAGDEAGANIATGILDALRTIPIAGAVVGIGVAIATGVLVGIQQGLSIEAERDLFSAQTGLDEDTSALDEPAEAMLYRLLLDRLPDAAIVSIGHRSSLVVFHDRFLSLKPDGKGRHRLGPVSPDEGAQAADEMGLSLV